MIEIFRHYSRSIASRAIVLAITPLILFSLVMGVVFVSNAITTAEENLRHHGLMVAKSFAQAVEYGMYVGDLGMLRTQAEVALVDIDIYSVSILNEAGKSLVQEINPDFSEKPAKTELIREPIVTSTSLLEFDAVSENAGNDTSAASSILGEVLLEISFSATEARKSQVLKNTIFYVLLGLGLSIVLGGWMAAGLLRPINRIIETVEKLRRGDLSARVAVQSKNELLKLETGINAMAETIESSQETLESEVLQATRDLEVTVEKLTRRNRELQLARSTAEKAGQAKAEFLALVSHELRTPLNSVIGFTNLLAQQVEDPRDLEYVRIIHQAGDQLLNVINDVLNLSKLDSGQMDFADELFDPLEVIESTVGLFSHDAHKKALEIVLMVHHDTPALVRGDDRRFNQVLANLIDNAIKFTAEGHVLVEADSIKTTEGEYLRVTVADTGIGIAEDKCEEIFKPFSQGERAIDKQFGGTGLGLSISRMMMEEMKGELGILPSYTQGARFFAQLPAQSRSARSESLAADLATVGKRVLLIESHAFQRRAVRNQLVALGMNVTAQADREMLNTPEDLLKLRFDVIVIGMNHQEVKEQNIIQRLEAGVCSNIPKLMLVGDEELCSEICSRFETLNRLVTTKPLRQSRLLSYLCRLLDTAVDSTPNLEYSTARQQVFTRRALVGDDHELGRRLLSIVLKQHGLEVVAVSSGPEVIEKLQQETFDIAFLDLHMPGMDGVETCRRIRSLDGISADFPVVVVTADVSFADEVTQHECRFDEIVYKPYTDDSLVAVLEQWFSDTEFQLKALPDIVGSKTVIGKETVDAAVAGHLQALNTAIAQQDRAEIKNQAHQLLGVAGFFELDSMRELLLQMNQTASQESFENLQQWTQQLEELHTTWQQLTATGS